MHCWWECRLLQPLWKTVWSFLKKLKVELPYDLAIPLLDIYLKKPKTLIRKNICTPMFVATLFGIAKIWKQPRYPLTDEWIKKLWFIYTVECYLAIKKNEVLPFVTAWMDLEYNAKRNKSDRERQIPYDFMYMWNLNSKINKIKNRLIDTENRWLWRGG